MALLTTLENDIQRKPTSVRFFERISKEKVDIAEINPTFKDQHIIQIQGWRVAFLSPGSIYKEKLMKIADKTFVAMDYCLKLDSGEEADSSQEGQPLTFITGTGQIIPGLDNALTGMSTGDSATITVEAEDAYGPVQEELMQTVPRSQFPPDQDVQPGMAFQAQGPQGPFMIIVKAVEDDNVTVDLNHPMAGQRLHFDVKIVEVRDPSQEELDALANMGGGGGCGCGCGEPEEAAKDGGCGSGSGGCACS